ncbi:MAG: circadian clock protein KaiA [Cyanobacteria bacterium P01_H01_bin.15]
MTVPLFVSVFAPSELILSAVTATLTSERYQLKVLSELVDLCELSRQELEEMDCLICSFDVKIIPTFQHLSKQGILLPSVILETFAPSGALAESARTLPYVGGNFWYHHSEVRLPVDRVSALHQAIQQAITQFLALNPNCSTDGPSESETLSTAFDQNQLLILQQQRLGQKLRERLSYVGVFYKRDPALFLRNLPPAQQDRTLKSLANDYRLLILAYFTEEPQLNRQIDRFVNRVFFADISVSKILEMHMLLVDEFSQQLKLEGRSDEILLDYRLALIDVIAHLCELFRRSVPRETDELEPLDNI